MQVLILAGVLALAASQSPNIDQSVLIDIFGTPNTTKPNIEPRQPLEEVSSTLDPTVLEIVFGKQKTANPGGTTITDVTRSTTYANVAGHTTVKLSILIEVFGTLSTEDVNSTRNVQVTRKAEVETVPTVNPTILIQIFGTPPSPKSNKNQNESIEGIPQGNRSDQDLPTVKPSILTEIFGTPSTSNSSSQEYGDRNSKNINEGTRNVNVEGLPTVDPSLLIDIFGTAPTPTEKSPRQGFEDITVKPTQGPSTFVDKDGSSCQCVPYYLCDANNVGVDVNNASVTGWGTLDIRFGDEDNTIDRHCQESVEVCCAIPKDPSEVPPQPKPHPQPDPTQVKGCGYRNPRGLGVTITGGTGAESQFGEFPWVVALLDNRNSSYAGVGVLIHPQVVMTGAHIAQKYGPNDLKIRAGEWDTQTIKEIYPYQERTVESTIIHENFQPKSLKNDIALLRLQEALPISEHINVICMPDYEEVFDSSKNCVANGWGKMHFGQSNRYAVILKKVEVDMVPYTRCNTLLKRTRLGHNFKLHNSFVCAGGEAGKDTCQGDGGAPLACPIGNNRYKLTGLVAWGIGCGQQDVPAVYTNVPLFRQWVDDKMADWGFEATSYRISK